MISVDITKLKTEDRLITRFFTDTFSAAQQYYHLIRGLKVACRAH